MAPPYWRKQSVTDNSGDPARANFILARVAIMHRDVPPLSMTSKKQSAFPRIPDTLAWSHIYYGRIHEHFQDEREPRRQRYRAALTVRDGQADTGRRQRRV